MKKFALTTKLGEVITNVTCNNLTEAIKTLSIKKQLTAIDLLTIYKVTEIS